MLKTVNQVDVYEIKASSVLSDFDRRTLFLLYQPILGNEALSVYNTLFELANKPAQTHYQLIMITQLSMPQLIRACERLEAVSLLYTYIAREDETQVLYELALPQVPQQFFADPLFSALLYSYVGASAYYKLQAEFVARDFDYGKYRNVSARFDDVFSLEPLQMVPSSLPSENKSKAVRGQMQLKNTGFSFEQMYALLPVQIFNRQMFTTQNLEQLEKLAYLYQLDSATMAKVVYDAFSVITETIDFERANELAKEYMLLQYGKHDAKIVEQAPSASVIDQPKNDEERLIRTFQSFSPHQFLKKRFDGMEPTQYDMNIIKLLLNDYKLAPEVINVLLNYVLDSSDNKLPKAFIEAIASQWKRNGVTNAKGALEALRTHQKQAQARTKDKGIRKPEVAQEEYIPTYTETEKKRPTVSDDELERILKDLK